LHVGYTVIDLSEEVAKIGLEADLQNFLIVLNFLQARLEKEDFLREEGPKR
jgi:hypothetical protein